MNVLGELQSALDPAGPEAAGIAQLTWVLFGGGLVIFAGVMLVAALALLKPRAWLASTKLVIAGGIVCPLVTLSALLVYSWIVSPRVANAGPADLVIEVISEQWWWRVHYLDSDGKIDFRTANEIRIPVGRIVEVRLRSADVLHSFWVPALAGKLDLIPGRENRLRLVADRAGRFRGQCAEYCGGPHALMAFLVMAEAPERFDIWRAAQRQPQHELDPNHPGRELFLSHCAVCHSIRSTPAVGERGPDLTHYASRVSLGAGILPNNSGTTASWIASNQHIKPGNLMPEFRAFTSEELRALANYLSTLE